MTENLVDPLATEPAAVDACAQCSTPLTPDDRVEAGGRAFCRSCYGSLRAELERAVGAMSSDVNYAAGTAGATLGATAGVLAWWGFTVVTGYAFGLVAVVIGYLTARGAVHLSGGKRSAGLQAISIVVAVIGFVVATYLVNMTFINRQLAADGSDFRVPFPPSSPDLLIGIVSAGFGLMDVVFLAIVVYEAWKIPRPIRLAL